MPRIENLSRLAEVLGLEFYFGERRSGQSGKQPPVSQEAAAAPDRYECLFRAQRALLDMSLALDGMYPTTQVWGEVDEDGLHQVADGWFRVWLARRGAIPEHCGMTEVEGDEMEPTLCDGAAVLVSRDHRTPGPVGVFMLRDGERRIYRRLRREGGAWIAYGDNLECPPMPVRGVRSTIVGQVIYSAREHFSDAGPYCDDMKRLRAQLGLVTRMLGLDYGNAVTDFICSQPDDVILKLARSFTARALAFGKAPVADKELLHAGEAR